MKLDNIKLRKALLLLRTLNLPRSKDVINLLSDGSKMTVTQIEIALRWEQTVASQSLARLRRCDIVTFEAKGKNKIYQINQEKLSRALEIAAELAEEYQSDICFEPAEGKVTN